MLRTHIERITRYSVIGCVSALALVLTGCREGPFLPIGDPLPRAVATGLSADGRLQYFAPLCPGEQVISVQVLDYRTHWVLWEASGPTKSIREGGRITVGASEEFEQVKVPLVSPLPDSLGLELSFGRKVTGVQASRQSVPSDLAGSDTVLSDTGERMKEADFRAQTIREAC